MKARSHESGTMIQEDSVEGVRAEAGRAVGTAAMAAECIAVA